MARGIVVRKYLKVFVLGVWVVLFCLQSFSQIDSLSIYDLSLSQLSDITITSATKSSQKIIEIPSTIRVVTASDIQEKGYITLEDVLADLPGFQFRNTLGLNSYVFQRGIPSQNNLTLVLVDGIQINELNSGGFYAGGLFNLADVERIEVVYGPASVAYGTNAVAGIINIVTRGFNPDGGKVSGTIGSFSTLKGNGYYATGNTDTTLNLRISCMVRTTQKADLKGKAGDNNWTDEMDNFEHDYSIGLKIGAGEFLGGINLFYKQASTATWQRTIGSSYKDHGTSWNILFLNSYAKYRHEFEKATTLTSMLYHRIATVLNNTIYYIVDTAQIGYYRPNSLTGLESILELQPGETISLTGGVTVEFEHLAKNASLSFSNSPDIKPPTPESPSMVNNSLVSVFLEPQINLIDNLILSGGLRFDESSVYNHVVTPRSGLSYSINNIVVRCSYSEAFRAPKAWDYTDGLGNASLLPEKMKSFETGLSASLNGKYKLELIGYFNHLNNAITKEVLPAGYRWINSNEFNTVGTELSTQYAFNEWKSSLHYTFTQTTTTADAFIPEISKHTGGMSVTYSLNDHFKINLRGNYVGKRENTKVISANKSMSVDPYFVFHTAISLLNWNGWMIQGMIQNIFNTEYYHTSNRAPERYRQPQRSVFLTLGYGIDL